MIGKAGRDISQADADSYIAGYGEQLQPLLGSSAVLSDPKLLPLT